MKNPPILISIIGFFAALAGFGYLFFGLRVLGFDWFGILGDLPAFEHVGLWGWLAVVTGIIWLLAAVGLWALQPWARLFAMIIAGFALFEAVLAFFQFPGQGVAFGMAIMPALILWYLSTAEVKAAFGEGRAGGGTGARRGTGPVAAPGRGARGGGSGDGGRPAAPKPVEAPVAVGRRRRGGFRPRARPTPRHQMKIEDVEGIGSAYAEKLAAVGIKTTTTSSRLVQSPMTARGSPTDGDQRQSDPRLGRQGRSHAGPWRRAAVQRPPRGGRGRLSRRTRAAEPGQPRDHRAGGHRGPARHRPSDPE